MLTDDTAQTVRFVFEIQNRHLSSLVPDLGITSNMYILGTYIAFPRIAGFISTIWWTVLWQCCTPSIRVWQYRYHIMIAILLHKMVEVAIVLTILYKLLSIWLNKYDKNVGKTGIWWTISSLWQYCSPCFQMWQHCRQDYYNVVICHNIVNHIASSHGKSPGAPHDIFLKFC